MFRNYLLIAIRSIFKRKLFTFINIIGLSISISTGLLLILMLVDQFEYDRFHSNEDRIFRVLSKMNSDGGLVATSPMPLRETLLEEYEGIDKVVRFKGMLGGDIKYNETTIPLAGYYCDEDFFNMFGFELEHGDPGTALKEPYSLVLSQEAADKLFQEVDPIGKIVSFNDRGLNMLGFDLDIKDVKLGDFTVRGVVKNTGKKSHIKFDLLSSWSTLEVLSQNGIDETKFDDWMDIWNTHTYIMTKEGLGEEDLNTILAEITKNKYVNIDKKKAIFEAQSLSDISPGKLVGNMMSIRMPKEGFYFLGFLTLIIILSACFNYTNLSIARSLTRSKEIALRKINGAYRYQVFIQFIIEAVLISLIALIFSVLILQVIKPGFSGLWINKYMSIGLHENLFVYVIFIFFAIFIGMIAGLVPAWLLSSFKPLSLLSNKIDRSSTGKGFFLFSKPTLGKTLIVLQLSVSLFFIITTSLLFFQLKYYSNAELGFSKDNIINVNLRGNDYQLMSREFSAWSGIKTISASSILPATMIREGSNYTAVDADPDSVYMDYISSDANFIENLGFQMVAGTEFSKDLYEGNKRYIIVNEAAARKLGYEPLSDIIGKNFLETRSKETKEVIGIIKDFNFDVFDKTIQPFAFIYNPDAYRYLNIKVSGDRLNETIGFLESKWKELDKIHSFKYQFFDEQLAESQGIFGDVMSIVGFVSIIAIIIASMGLLGMATYSVETRIKEIGIRKVLGASAKRILFHISKGYVYMLLIAIVITTPIAYYLNNLWLENFAIRVNFGIGILSIGIIILLLLGLLAIGSQTLKAAMTNPSDILRDE